MSLNWIPFLVVRQFLRKPIGLGVPSSMIAISGLSMGVIALIVVISIMNGLQHGFVEDILEISSYHIRVTGEDPAAAGQVVVDRGYDRLASISGVRSVLPFRELHALLRSDSAPSPIPALIKALPPNSARYDPEMIAQLELYEGSFNLENQGAVIGGELARTLGIAPGRFLTMIVIPSGAPTLKPLSISLRVAGIFRSGFYEIDSSLVLISLNNLDYSFSGIPVTYGIKLDDHRRDRSVIETIVATPGLEGARVESWREHNYAFFAALRLEKTAIALLIGLMVIMVAINIYNNQKRNIIARMQEIGTLSAVGASPLGIQLSLLGEGVMIGFIGSTLGTMIGLLIIGNLASILQGLNRLFIWALVSWRKAIHSYTPSDGIDPVTMLFSIPDVPVRVIPQEVVLIYIFSFATTLVASLLAGIRLRKIEPARILRYE